MPRPLRIEFEGAWYHVMNRGLNHRHIFDNAHHRVIFLDLLKKITYEYLVEIHAFCLMDNHYHLLIRTPLANLSLAMRYLDGVYTQRYNYQVKRDGPLFRGRYKAILIEEDSYVLQVSRYIHRNPVEANICNHPSLYPWCSYNSYISNQNFDWLHTSFILSLFGESTPEVKFVEYTSKELDPITSDFYLRTKIKSIFGSKKFMNEKLSGLNASYVEATKSDINQTKWVPDIENMLKIVADYFSVPISFLENNYRGRKNRPRNIAIFLARILCRLKHREIAEYFGGIKYQSISAHINRCEKQLKSDNSFAEDISVITALLKEK